jgi:pimeloyl-ACP methyl ester carboxylesterase
MSRHRLLIAGAILTLGACSSGGQEPVDRFVDLKTHTLHAVVAGRGLPAVVIDGGIGAGAAEYRDLQARIATVSTVVTYDRAGYDESEAGPLPRHSGVEAEELHELLKRLQIPAPYVLVGHSLGGLNAQVFAARYRDEVAALVLLDPPALAWLRGGEFSNLRELATQMTVQWQTAADRADATADEQERSRATFFRMLASEHREMFDQSARLASAIETFGETPVVVIASGVPNPQFGPDAAEYQQFWIEESRALSHKSSQGEFYLAADSSHHLHAEALELVEQCIRSLLARMNESK